MRTAVVILNWNTRDYLRRFLPPLLGSCGPEGAVIVADSGSTDGSLEMLAAEFPQVETVPLMANYGFTGGYDRAMERVLSAHPELEYLVLINSDIEVCDGWLEPLVEHMDSHPQCGVCGPKLHALEQRGTDFVRTDRFEYAGAAGGYLDRFGYPFCRGRVPGRVEQDRGQYDSTEDLMWISGACMLTRASLWKELGGLDDRFFAHMEEIDYCWRAQLAGWKVTSVPRSTVWHIGGGTLPQESPFKLKLNYRNNLLMLSKNLQATIGPVRAWARIAFRKHLDCGSALVYLLSGKAAFARAVLDAHREYRRAMAAGSASKNVSGHAPVDGLKKICVLLHHEDNN